MISPDALIEQARSWRGVKFLHQGRTRHGADCLGYVAGVMGELGSQTFLEHLPLNYARAPQGDLEARLSMVSREIPLQSAALVLIRWPQAKHASHAAIFTGSNLIHCTRSEGKVIEHGYRGAWVKQSTSIWALPLVTYACSGDSLAM